MGNDPELLAYDKYAGGWDADGNYHVYDDMGVTHHE